MIPSYSFKITPQHSLPLFIFMLKFLFQEHTNYLRPGLQKSFHLLGKSSLLASTCTSPYFGYMLCYTSVWYSFLGYFDSDMNRVGNSPCVQDTTCFSTVLENVPISMFYVKQGGNTSLVVQLLNHVQLFEIPWTAVCQAFPPFTISQSLLRFMSIESVMLSNHLIFCLPLLLPSIFPSIGDFSKESAIFIRWPKDQSFSFNISLSNEYSGLISFRIDWFDPLAFQGLLRVSSSTTI